MIKADMKGDHGMADDTCFQYIQRANVNATLRQFMKTVSPKLERVTHVVTSVPVRYANLDNKVCWTSTKEGRGGTTVRHIGPNIVW